MEVSFWNSQSELQVGAQAGSSEGRDVAALFTTGVLLWPQPTAADPEVARPRLRAAL